MIDREQKMERAKELFFAGYNCAQAVAAAFAPETGMTEQQLARLSGGLGGGLGGLRVTCGAVSAMCLVMSWLNGYDDPEDYDGKKHLYATEQRMAAHFTDRFDTFICRSLLESMGVEPTSVPSQRSPEYYRKRHCAKYVEACAGILADELNELNG